MKFIVVIIVYERFHNLQRWLECWPLCDQHGAELVIIHTGTDHRFKEACDVAGVRYVPRENRGLDIGATQDVFAERLEGFPNDWDYLLWITDDVLPMKRAWLAPYIANMSPTVVPCMMVSFTPTTHIRTVAYCVSKALSRSITFPVDPVTDKEHGYLYEYKGGRATLTNQIHALGAHGLQVEPNETAGLWDTGYGKRLERMDEHFDNFPVPPKAVPIHHFYHIYADGKWQEPVEEHIRAMKMGLLDQLTTFNIGIVGHPRNRRAVKQYLVETGVFFNIVAQENVGWEAVTQQPMHDFAQNNDGLILYAHSKGAANTHEVNARWRRSMTWHNVIQWQLAVEKLKDHGTYGCHFIQPLISGMPEHRQGNWMYAGTFYWCRAELMRTWMRVPLTHRFESEGWVGYKYAEEPWPVWDCTPYFPNTNTFMDGWVNDPNYNPPSKGISLPPQKTINVLP